MENNNNKGFICSIVALIIGIIVLILSITGYNALILTGLDITCFCCGGYGVKNGNRLIASIGIILCIIGVLINA